MCDISKKRFKVEKIVFYNAESCWGVMATVPVDKLSVEDQKALVNKWGNVTVSGNFEGIYEGATLILSADIITNPKYGKQLQIVSFNIEKDTSSREGIINFLSRSLIRGISTQNAEKIYDTFGSESIKIVLTEPEKLISINGIGRITVDKVAASVNSYVAHKELIDYCTNLGIKYTLINKIKEEFGNEALSIIKLDPFKLLEISDTLSFKQVDEIFIKMGGKKDSERRLELAFVQGLKYLCVMEGSTGCVSKRLKQTFYKLTDLSELDGYYEKTGVRLSSGDNPIALAEEGSFSGMEDGIIYYNPYVKIENKIAYSLLEMNEFGESILKIDEKIMQEEINNFETFELNKEQKKAVRDCLHKQVAVLTGLGGTGKTTVTKAIYRTYKRCGFVVELICPTAKACRRLEECLGDGVEAQTIHKYLGISKNEDLMENVSESIQPSVSEDTVLIIDEASMLDILLFNRLLNCAKKTTRVLLIGDNNQLPSVQAGNVLGDVISSGKIHVSYLKDITRQAENSHIIKFSNMINNGEVFDPCEHEDFHYEEFGTADELLDFFYAAYTREIAKYSLLEVQVIAPYKKGELGMEKLNKYIQERYNTNGEEVISYFRIGDRVRHTRNNYKNSLYNGDTGVVIPQSTISYPDIPLVTKSRGDMMVNYTNKLAEYTACDIDELTLAYCSTVHSSQGSEYPVVFVILDDTSVNDYLLIRRLLYTAVSRGKKKVYILTKPYLVDKCISNNSYRKRITKLADTLRTVHLNVF